MSPQEPVLAGNHSALYHDMSAESKNFLFCDEQLPICSPSPTPTKGKICIPDHPLLFSNANDEECRHILRDYMQREHTYSIEHGYLENLHLSANLSSLRFRAVRWIIMACGRLNLAYQTTFAAVNYLDRFMSMNCCIKWQPWMIELLSIACLSIASKVDEVSVPSLNDFQLDDLDHTFQPSTIQQMELAVLKALDYRLNCITPYSYLNLMICSLTMSSTQAALTSRTTELLLQALLEAKFLEYRASTIALSALKCSLEELFVLNIDALLSNLEHVMPVEHKEDVDICHRIMEEWIVEPLCCPPSPITVIPMQRTQILDMNVDINRIFYFKDQNQDLVNWKENQKIETMTT